MAPDIIMQYPTYNLTFEDTYGDWEEMRDYINDTKEYGPMNKTSKVLNPYYEHLTTDKQGRADMLKDAQTNQSISEEDKRMTCT